MRLEQIGNKAARTASVLGLILAASALALLVAYWTWHFALRPLPPPPVVVEASPDRLAQQLQARQLFGKAENAPEPSVATPEASHIALVGIVSGRRRKAGVALISIDGKKPVTVTIGEEVAPGLVLSRVGPDQVELVRHGQTITVMLSAKK